MLHSSVFALSETMREIQHSKHEEHLDNKTNNPDVIALYAEARAVLMVATEIIKGE